jgi:hypothetical protein
MFLAGNGISEIQRNKAKENIAKCKATAYLCRA